VPDPSQPNPLLALEFRIPFDRIRAAHVEPAAAELLREARARLDAIAAQPGERTFENTMRALDHLTEPLDCAMGVVRHLEAVATYPELRAAFNAVEPEVSAFYSGIPLQEGLWKGIQAYAATPEGAGLEGERRRYLDKTVDDFRRHGADLDAPGKKRLEEIDVELTQLTTKFSENVLDSTNAFDLLIANPADLAGLPATALASARESAARKGREGWRFTLQSPDYFAVMTYLDSAAIRRQVYLAHSVRGTAGQWDNRPLVARILDLRREKARLLGFADFADLVLEDRMAHNGARAMTFLEDLKAKTERRFGEENRELLEFRRSLEGPDAPELEPWDVAYYAEKQRAALYDFDEEALRPYFPLERVTAGLFDLVNRLYGIRVSEEPGVPVWDLQVRYYNVHDGDGAFLGGFYADWYPRENKRDGGWMDALITGGPAAGGFQPPDLRESHPPGGRPAGAPHASRSGDHLPRVRPSAAPFAQPGGNPHAGRLQCGVGFRRAALADHGELVLGTPGAGPVRAPLGNRRANPRRPLPKDEARAHLPRRQRPDAATRYGFCRPAPAHPLFTRAGWRRGRVHADPLAGIRARTAAARARHDRGLHPPVWQPGGLRRRLLFLQMGRSPGRRRLHPFSGPWHLQPRDRD